MSLPEGTYDVVRPRSWDDLTRAVREAPIDDTRGPQLADVELGPTGEDQLAQRRRAMGKSAYAGATLDLTVLWQHYTPGSKHILAENADILVKFEPTDPDNPSEPAAAYVVPLVEGSSPEYWRGSVHIEE